MCDHHTNDKHGGIDRRNFLKTSALATAAVAATGIGAGTAYAHSDKYAPPANPALPPSDMKLNLKRTALVVTDPQVDFLSPTGVAWGVVSESVKEQNTVENIDRLFAAAKKADITVAVSPHYYYPTDKGWMFEGALEKLMHKIKMFDRPGVYNLEGFEGSGADFLPQYKKYIHDACHPSV